MNGLSQPAPALVVVTQSLLGVLFLVGVAAIVILPGFSAEVAVDLPEYAALRTPLLVLSIAITVVALIALALASLLVHRIHRGTVLAHSSLFWVDMIVVALACGVVLVIASFIAISRAQAGSPFIALIQVTICFALMALACITLVLRSLLRRAILMRSELDEVV